MVKSITIFTPSLIVLLLITAVLLPARYGWLCRRVRRRSGAIPFVMAFTFITCMTTSLHVRTKPVHHDEFSNLLQADTFANGRLANEPHSFYKHFESFHILQQPKYASKYPPALGALMAVGQVTTGFPLVGVWLAYTLAVGSIVWALQIYVPARWALLAGLYVSISPTFQYSHFLSWSSIFFASTPAVAGGALLYGSLGRILSAGGFRNGIYFGTGLIALALSRPFEGFIVSLPAVFAACRWANSQPWYRCRRPILGAALVLFAGIVAIAQYNRAVTGDPLKLPYVLHTEQYVASPLLIWQTPRKIAAYNHDVMEEFHTSGWEWQHYERQKTLGGIFSQSGSKLRSLWDFYVTPMLFGTFAVLFLVRLRRVRYALGIVCLGVLAVVASIWGLPLYFGPAVPALVYLQIQGIRRLAVAFRNPWFARSFAAGYLIIMIIQVYIAIVKPAAPVAEEFCINRSMIISQLDSQAGTHLILVQYRPDHSPLDEWVYNLADIDSSRIVWARTMGEKEDAPLVEYFVRQGRTIWVLDADANPPQLQRKTE